MTSQEKRKALSLFLAINQRPGLAVEVASDLAEHIVSPEIWTRLSRDERGIFRSCVKLLDRELKKLDRMERSVKQALMES